MCTKWIHRNDDDSDDDDDDDDDKCNYYILIISWLIFSWIIIYFILIKDYVQWFLVLEYGKSRQKRKELLVLALIKLLMDWRQSSFAGKSMVTGFSRYRSLLWRISCIVKWQRALQTDLKLQQNLTPSSCIVLWIRFAVLLSNFFLFTDKGYSEIA